MDIEGSLVGQKEQQEGERLQSGGGTGVREEIGGEKQQGSGREQDERQKEIGRQRNNEMEIPSSAGREGKLDSDGW